ncbi:GatB/YqeY domain-containing protein [Candidatus Peregrinibacteria bacterium]|nr:GatB/YqeY domain-containing protein [Candidatus Peregrinibacteria bacterium]
MNLQEQIQADIIVAMKAKENKKLTTLRGLTAAIKNAIIDHDGDFTNEDTEKIVARQVKQLKDAMKDFEAGGREDLVEQNKIEISVLETYLPEQMSDEELQEIVSQVIFETGASSPADMGKIMGKVMAKVQGKADGNKVKEAVLVLLK